MPGLWFEAVIYLNPERETHHGHLHKKREEGVSDHAHDGP